MDVHERLKRFGSQILKERGFSKVEFELPVMIEGTFYRVDVAGFSRYGRKVAVECNYKHLPKNKKIEALRKHFDEVIEIDAGDLIAFLDEELTKKPKPETKIRYVPMGGDVIDWKMMERMRHDMIREGIMKP